MPENMEEEDLSDDMEEDRPQSTEMFSAKDIPKIVDLFREADADDGGGLDIDEFCVVIKKLDGNLTTEDVTILHMQIDINCDGTVDIGELMNFLLHQNKASQRMDFKNQSFPKPFQIVPVDSHKTVVSTIFRPFNDNVEPGYGVSTEQTRPYKKGQYLTISSDGVLNFWTDRFETPYTFHLSTNQKTLPYSKIRKMSVNDMVYIRELKQLAVATSDRELLFYDCTEFPTTFGICHALIVDNRVNTMNYWSNGKKAVFSFGDIKGCLSAFISHNIKSCGLFPKEVYEHPSIQDYPTAYVRKLLKHHSKDFLSFEVPIFGDVCSQIRYFPLLDSFAICGSSSKTMVLATLPKLPNTKVSKTIFESHGHAEFFTCVEYSPSAGYLMTGGTDGLLRVWFLHKTMSCEQELFGHVRPITHVMYNGVEKTFISLSDDKIACVWSENGWVCRQSFQAEGMGRAPISSVCLNIFNNELVVANSDIGKCLGRGTDVFRNTLTTHEKPLCSTLYHSIFKQVVSICQNGVVTVWDITTGKAVMQFSVTPQSTHVGLIAISFDEPQRRIFTVSQDGKVRLWNFNNGTELGVLPVTVPKEVTGIVCINDRIFVSGRDSKKIFDLDIEGYENRFLEHDYLNDVTSMDVHEDALVTASSNENIVFWKTETAEVLYWINARISSRTQMPDKKTAQGRSWSLPVDKKQNNVKDTEKKAQCKKSTAKTSLPPMSTDVNEHILLAGDSTGRIYHWDIQGFGFKRREDKGRCVSLCPPPLLGTWQSHLTAVVSVKCDPDCKNIITAGLDCNVWKWTNTGRCIGLFGRDEWHSTQLSPEEDADQKPAARPGTAETRKKSRTSQMPLETPSLSPPTSPLPDLPPIRNYPPKFERLYQDITDTLTIIDIPSDEELFRRYRKLMKVKPEPDKMNDEEQHQSKKDKQQFTRKGKQTSAHTSKVSPLKTTPTTSCTTASDSSPHMQQFDGAVKLPKLKYGRVFKIQQRHTLKDISEHTSKRVHLPPISDTVQLTHSQAPQAPQASLTTGRNSAKNSPHMQLPVNTVKSRPEHSSKRLHFPPISDTVQLTCGQSQLKTNPPQASLTTDRTNATKRRAHHNSAGGLFKK
ncbi:WD repeat-containing protein on Y chromosome-like [Morone saxatilis]|uniref:WD repeat-containing protein on Y chromosome-like n=1 Tax=Morone saxatilis TaxID=34816 RepID=UPI0015E1EB76|nr:WD repeat-containing protein on Y chromosome-like [Morone saxatilis]